MYIPKDMWSSFNTTLGKLKEEMDNSFADFMHESNYRVEADEDGVVIKYNLAGTPKEGIDIKVKGELLYITAKSEDSSFEDRQWLSPSIDVDKITSKYSDGILVITLPYVKTIDVDVE